MYGKSVFGLIRWDEDFVDGTMHQVVEQIWALAIESGEWSTHDLLVRLNDEAARSLVTKLINIEEGKLTDPARVFLDCIGKIQKEKQKKTRGQLLEDIGQADALQDTEKSNRLKEQFYQLPKSS